MLMISRVGGNGKDLLKQILYSGATQIFSLGQETYKPSAMFLKVRTLDIEKMKKMRGREPSRLVSSVIGILESVTPVA